MSFPESKVALGFIPANRGFFSAELAAKMRQADDRGHGQAGHRRRRAQRGPDQGRLRREPPGGRDSVPSCSAATTSRASSIGAVNFGDEQAAAWTVRQAGLDVPVLIFGCQEEEMLTPNTPPPRRLLRAALHRRGPAPDRRQVHASPQRPICFPTDESFAADLDWFVRVCRVVGGVRNARYGQIGARPDAFWTCRFDEKQLQRLGATTVVLDLSEAIAGAEAMADDDPEVQKIVEPISEYADASGVKPRRASLRSAKLELFLRRLREENGIDALAIQCWTSIQANYGVCSCTTMSRLGDEGMPCACEVGHPGHALDARRHAGQRLARRTGRLEQPAQRGRRAGQRLALRRVSRVVCQDAAQAGRAGDHRLQRRRPSTRTPRVRSSSSPSRRR